MVDFYPYFSRNLQEIDDCIKEQMDTIIAYKMPSRDCKDLMEYVNQLKKGSQFDKAVDVCQGLYIWTTTTTTTGPNSEGTW